MAEDPRTELVSYITEDYPPTYIFSSVYDGLKAQCKPFADILRKKGVRVQSRIYGTKKDIAAGHVFHVNLRLPIGERCNKDQTAFFRRLSVG